MKNYKIVFFFGDDKYLSDVRGLEKPDEFLDKLSLSATYTFTNEKEKMYKINLAHVKYVSVSEYTEPIARTRATR